MTQEACASSTKETMFESMKNLFIIIRGDGQSMLTCKYRQSSRQESAEEHSAGKSESVKGAIVPASCETLRSKAACRVFAK
jgi:hypothetical protein